MPDDTTATTSTEDFTQPDTIVAGPLTIRKISLKEYVNVFTKLKEIPQMLAKLDAMDQKEALAQMPMMIMSAFGEVSEVLAIASDHTPEEVMDLLNVDTAGLALDAFLKLNNFLGLAKKLTKVGQ